MKNLLTKTKILSASLVLAMGVAGSVNAATVKFGHADNLNGVAQFATDGTGTESLTSVNVPASNVTNGANGFFVETFDTATQTLDAKGNPFPTGPQSPGSEVYNVAGASTGCGINGVGAGVTVSTSNGIDALGVRTGSVANVAAAPRDDSTCFAYTPRNAGQSILPSWVDVDYSGLLTNFGDVGITFLGFYWGSIDIYNDFEFFNANGDSIQTITGASLLAQAGGTSGNQLDPESNLYVAIDFKFNEAFTKLRINSTGVAGEFDNIVIGLQNRPVPAPTGLALLGLGLIGLGLRKRLSK